MPSGKDPVSYSFSLLAAQLCLFSCLVDVVLRHRIDVIRADDTVLTGVPSIIVGKLTMRPVILFIAGSLTESFSRRFITRSTLAHMFVCLLLSMARVLERFSVRYSSASIGVTNDLVSAARTWGCARVFRGCVYLDPTKLKSHEPAQVERSTRIIFVGRLESEKGLEYLVRALARIRKLHEVEALIVGRGSFEDILRKRIRALGLEDCVLLCGAIGHEKVLELLSICDVFVLPSLSEGLPVALLEAMGTGLAVVVSAVGGVKTLIQDGVDGILVQAGDVDSLSRAILSLLSDPDLRTRLGTNAARKVRSLFDADLNVRSQIKLFSEVSIHTPRDTISNG